VDAQNHPTDYILARDVAHAAGLDVGKFQYSIKKLAVLPEGKLAIMVTDGHTPTLAVYDPLGRKLLSHWTETQKYAAMETYTDQRTGKPFEKVVQEIAQLHCGPVPSRDGSRLFAMSEGDVILTRWAGGLRLTAALPRLACPPQSSQLLATRRIRILRKKKHGTQLLGADSGIVLHQGDGIPKCFFW
jgi:hypothetical protein